MDIRFEVLKEKDIDKVLNVYNSNKGFLENHLGCINVSKDFINYEISEMKKIGFSSMAIKNRDNEIVGICDFKEDEEAYLSLLMLDSKFKGRGLGSKVYNKLEKEFKAKNVNCIRIDVVYNYENNVVGFWKKLGFSTGGKIELEWNGYKSEAIKMYKSL